MESPETRKNDGKLVSLSEARSVKPDIVEPDPLALKEADNSHAQATQRAEQGLIGIVFGSRMEKPGNIAALVVMFSFLMLACAYLALPNKDPIPDSYFKLASIFTGIIGIAMGYLFGSGGKG